MNCTTLFLWLVMVKQASVMGCRLSSVHTLSVTGVWMCLWWVADYPVSTSSLWLAGQASVMGCRQSSVHILSVIGWAGLCDRWQAIQCPHPLCDWLGRPLWWVAGYPVSYPLCDLCVMGCRLSSVHTLFAIGVWWCLWWIIGWIAPGWFERKDELILQNRPMQNS